MTNSSITIDESDGVHSITIFNASVTDGSYQGSSTETVGGLSSSALTIKEGQTVTLAGADATVIKELTITAPSGCTLQLIAEV